MAPRLARSGRPARTGAEVHRALRAHEYFRFYSAVRVTAKDMVYQSVRPVIERGRAELAARATRPDFRSARTLDLGYTIGHHTGAWKDRFPEAGVHGFDVSAPCLRYALARARSPGRALELRQMNAEQLDYADGNFDFVFSPMFLHEVPRAGISRVLREAHRVLRSGGLMLHMELLPNARPCRSVRGATARAPAGSPPARTGIASAPGAELASA